MSAAAPVPGAPGSSPDAPLLLHASTVAMAGRAVLITGCSGAGKSALALQLLALGAVLVADDITHLWRAGHNLMADAPDTIRGRIEARGVGILNAQPHGPAPVTLCIDLDTPETDRLPPHRQQVLLGHDLPILHNPAMGCLPSAIAQYLKAGRAA
ncbi:HPr kinase/phosphorylase [Lacimonas salitolerans]|uniref:HPr kinase/phosphorylase n=1 Tax=Lacimonas salitolerans TaxID=1323750 RepID=A0ABW4EHT2_9RHOB